MSTFHKLDSVITAIVHTKTSTRHTSLKHEQMWEMRWIQQHKNQRTTRAHAQSTHTHTHTRVRMQSAKWPTRAVGWGSWFLQCGGVVVWRWAFAVCASADLKRHERHAPQCIWCAKQRPPRIDTICDRAASIPVIRPTGCVMRTSASAHVMQLTFTWQWPSWRSMHDDTTTTWPRIVTTIRKLSTSRISVLVMSSSMASPLGCAAPNTVGEGGIGKKTRALIMFTNSAELKIRKKKTCKIRLKVCFLYVYAFLIIVMVLRGVLLLFYYLFIYLESMEFVITKKAIHFKHNTIHA